MLVDDDMTTVVSVAYELRAEVVCRILRDREEELVRLEP